MTTGGRITMHAPSEQRIVRPEASERRRCVEAQLRSLLGDPPGLELTSSCTHALEAAARLLGIGPSDEVVVPAFTFPSTANAVLATGASVRFADVDPTTGNVDASSVEIVTSQRTAAVFTLHYGGVASDVAELSTMCDDLGAALVEDAAHSLFGSYDGRPLGRFGRLAAFSFHRTKNVSSIEGGALVINDPALVAPAQILLDKGTNRAEFEAGRAESYEWCGFGSGWRLADPLVDLLDESLAAAPDVQARRAVVWDRYRRDLDDWCFRNGAGLPVIPPGAVQPSHLFWIRLPEGADRSAFVRHCDARGIDVARHYGSLPASRYGQTIADPRDRCPNADVLAARLVRLPLHHRLTDDDLERVLDAVTSWRPTRADTTPMSA